MAARIDRRWEPNRSCITLTVFVTMPPSVPRQPACTAAYTPRDGSRRRMGTQSAVSTATRTPG